MNNNNEENEKKRIGKLKKLNIINANIKRISEIKRHNMFSFAELIDVKMKEKISRRIQKLSSMKKYTEKKSSFAINLEQIEKRINILMDLEPFFSEFNDIMDNNGQKIITEISCESSEDIFEKNKIIYKYGDEIDNFYLILDGEVELFFPFTEEIYMNIDEFYIYILRLRRYNEMEMLNDVLLLNNGKYLQELGGKFKVDKYIYKLYLTYIQLKFDPDFLYQEDNKDNDNNNNNNLNNDNTIQINLDDIFNSREIKELVLRISDELIETIKWIMPEKIYEIVEDKNNYKHKKKIIKIPEVLLRIYKQKYKPGNITGQDYYQRILPPKIPNDKLISRKMIIMKYLKIDTLKKGNHFGEFTPDSFSLFSHDYLDIIKQTDLGFMKLHEYHNFRNMTVISSSYLHLYSFNKAIYMNYFSKYIEKKTFNKKKFLLFHRLFSNTKNKNLLKTYSICFKEYILKEGENIINENEPLSESNIYISFIVEGECQLTCNKTIPQIDEIIKILGKEDEIKNTYNQNVKDILNTPQYEDLVKEPIKIKLNFLTNNDIIGLTEYFNKDKYFINVHCSQRGTKIYRVDSRIIKLFIDSDEIIKENKNKIIYDKYKLLSEKLINQRKMFFDSLLNENKIKLEIDTGFKPIKIKFKSLPQINTYNRSMEKAKDIYPKSVVNKVNNNFKIITKLSHFKEDLDKLLVSVTHGFTLRDRRINKSKEFRKKYMRKMMKIQESKIEKSKYSRGKLNESKKEIRLDKSISLDKNFGAFIKTNSSLFRNIYRIIPSLNKNPLKKINSQYELILPYEYQKLKNSLSTSQINPLFYDDFNRSYNLDQYFNLKSNETNELEENRKLEYTLKIAGIKNNININYEDKPKKIFEAINNKRTNGIYKRIKIRKFGSNF